MLQPPVLEVTLTPVNSVSAAKFPSDSYPGTALTPTRAAAVEATDSARSPAALSDCSPTWKCPLAPST